MNPAHQGVEFPGEDQEFLTQERSRWEGRALCIHGRGQSTSLPDWSPGVLLQQLRKLPGKDLSFLVGESSGHRLEDIAGIRGHAMVLVILFAFLLMREK